MALDLMSLVAKLGMDSSEYEKGMDKAETGFKGFASKLSAGVGKVAKVAAGAAAAGAAAFTAVTAAVTKGVSEVAAFGDNIDKASQKLGISAQAYQEWDAVMQHSGTSIDSMSIGMKTLASKAAEGSDAFKKLGISQKDAAKMSREQLFSKTITALQNVGDANEKARLAQELFGRSAMELGPLLNTSAKDTQAMKDRVNELGGVMSNEAVKASAAYQDSLQDMNTAMDGWKRGLFATFLPSVTRVMDGVTDLFAGAKGGAKKIKKGIQDFIDNLGTELPKFLSKGLKIAEAVGGAVVSAIPSVVTRITGALPKIFDKLSGFVKSKGIPAIAKLIGGLFGKGQSSSLVNHLTKNLQKIFQDVSGILGGIGAKVKEFWTVVVQPILFNLLNFVTKKVLPGIHNALIRLRPILDQIGPVVSAAFQAIADFWSNTLYPVLGQIWDYVVGQLIPGVIEWLNKAIPVVANVFNKVKEFWDNTLYPVLLTVWTYITDTVVPKVVEAWDKFKDAVQNAFDKVKEFWDDPLSGILSTIWSYITETLVPDVVKAWGDFRDAVQNAFDKVKEFWDDPLSGILSSIWSYITETLVPDAVKAWGDFRDTVSDVFGKIKEFWTGTLQPALVALYDYVYRDLIPTLIVWFEYKLAPAIEGVFKGIKQWWEDYGKKAFEALRDFINDPIIPLIQTLGEKFEEVKTKYLVPVANWVKDTLIKVWEDLQGGLKGLVTFLTGTFTGDWSTAWDGLVAMVSAPFNALADILKVPINAVIDLLNGMIRSVRDSINTVIGFINRTLSITIPNVSLNFNPFSDKAIVSYDYDNPLWKWSANLPSVNWADNVIKKLAKGGILGEGQSAFVGEYAPELLRVIGGKAMVTPLSKVPARFPGGGQEMTVPRYSAPKNLVVKLILDGRELAQTLLPYNEAEEQRVGLKLAKGGV